MLLIALHCFNLDRHMAVWWAGTEVICKAAGVLKLVGITLQPAWQFMGCSNAFRQPFCQIDNKPLLAEVGPEGWAMCERVGGRKDCVCSLHMKWMSPFDTVTTPANITLKIVIGKMRKRAKKKKIKNLQWYDGNPHKYALFSISKLVFTAHVHMSKATLTGYQAMLRRFSGNLLLNSQHNSTNDTWAQHPSWQCS